jgi:hypothetical protein
MEKDTLNYTSLRSGRTYQLVMERRSYTDYAEFGNPASRFEHWYTHTDILLNGETVWFTTDDDVPAAIDRYEQPALAHMHSVFD